MDFKVVVGNIVYQHVDAIVNAASTELRGGGGVDGAIHKAAGPKLMEALKEKYPNGIKTGEAAITKAYKIHCKYIIHTAGPVYGRDSRPDKLLEKSILNSLKIAEENGCKSITFSAISTGVYGYPKNEFATIFFNVIDRFESDIIEQIFLCLLSNEFKELFMV